jgi:hypothetical protein
VVAALGAPVPERLTLSWYPAVHRQTEARFDTFSMPLGPVQAHPCPFFSAGGSNRSFQEFPLSGKNHLQRFPFDSKVVCCHECDQPLPLDYRCQLVVADVQPQPSGIADIISARTGMCGIKIYEAAWDAVYEHAVARTRIAMAYDLATCSQLTVCGRIVQGTQQLCRCSNLTITKRTKVIGHVSRQKCEHLPVLVVQAQEARRTRKPFRLQVTQDAVHETRSRRDGSAHGIPDAHNARCSPSTRKLKLGAELHSVRTALVAEEREIDTMLSESTPTPLWPRLARDCWSGAGEGNRTLVTWLGTKSSTIELHPRRSRDSRGAPAVPAIRMRNPPAPGSVLDSGARRCHEAAC